MTEIARRAALTESQQQLAKVRNATFRHDISVMFNASISQRGQARVFLSIWSLAGWSSMGSNALYSVSYSVEETSSRAITSGKICELFRSKLHIWSGVPLPTKEYWKRQYFKSFTQAASTEHLYLVDKLFASTAMISLLALHHVHQQHSDVIFCRPELKKLLRSFYTCPCFQVFLIRLNALFNRSCQKSLVVCYFPLSIIH